MVKKQKVANQRLDKHPNIEGLTEHVQSTIIGGGEDRGSLLTKHSELHTALDHMNSPSFADEMMNATFEDSVLGSAQLGTGERSFMPNTIPAPLFAGNSSAFSIDQQEFNQTNQSGFNTSKSKVNEMYKTTNSFAVPSPFLPRMGSRLRAISQLSGDANSISPREESLVAMKKVQEAEKRIQRKISTIHTQFENLDGSLNEIIRKPSVIDESPFKTM